MIKKIVLAINFGSSTPYLLQHAASLSNQYRASLIVVHVVEPIESSNYHLLQGYLRPKLKREYPSGNIDFLLEQLRSQIIDILTDEYMAGEIKLPRLEGVIVRPGDPADTILDISSEVNADMLIVGNSDSGFEVNPAAAGMTQKIVNHSPLPVYLIPNSKATLTTSHSQTSATHRPFY